MDHWIKASDDPIDHGNASLGSIHKPIVLQKARRLLDKILNTFVLVRKGQQLFKLSTSLILSLLLRSEI